MLIRAILLVSSLGLATPALAQAGDMTVSTFLAKADALKGRGPMALFSSDYKLLHDEGHAAGEAYRARLKTERAAGRPSSCPPQPVKVQPEQLMAFLRLYPEPTRARTTMRSAMADYFIRNYPCS